VIFERVLKILEKMADIHFVMITLLLTHRCYSYKITGNWVVLIFLKIQTSSRTQAFKKGMGDVEVIITINGPNSFSM